MAENYVQGNKLYVAGRDFSSTWTAISLMVGREVIDWTKGQDATRVAKVGLKTGALEVEGVTDFADDGVDEQGAGFLDLTNAPIIVGLPGSTSGDFGTSGYAMNAVAGSYSPMSNSIGERVNYALSALGASQVIRGVFFHDGDTARTATANGTGIQLGAVSATQKVMACAMCLSASAGDTLALKVQSDDADTWGSATDRITFTNMTTTGAYEWKELAGPVTDTWWRLVHTISGNGSESFNFVVLVAIVNAS